MAVLPFPYSSREKIADCLSAALRHPSASKPVADFLFSSLLESNFHPAHAVPPASLSVSLPAAFIRTTDLDRGPLDPPAPSDATVPPHALTFPSPLPQQSVREEKHALFLPVAAEPPYSLGYLLLHNPTEQCTWTAMDVFPRTFVTRFALNTITQDIVCVSHAPSAGCLGVHAVNVAANGARDMYMLAVPAHDYSFDNLPDTALWSIANTQYPGPDPGNQDHFKRLALTAENLAYQPPATDGSPPLSQQLAPLALQDSSSTSMPPHVHAVALSSLAAAHFGTFYSPMMRIDFALGPASVTSTTTSEHFPLPRSAATDLRSRLADLYYASVLSVSTDERLRPSTMLHQRIAPPALPELDEPCEFLADMPLLEPCSDSQSDHTAPISETTSRAHSATSSVSEFHDMLHQTPNSVPKPEAAPITLPKPPRSIAKRIQPRPPGMALTVVSVAQAGDTRQPEQSKTPQLLAEREQKRIARRERNRLSAARSNERRRLMLQGLKTDIASQRQRASQLIERLRIVTAENAELKQKVVEACGPVC